MFDLVYPDNEEKRLETLSVYEGVVAEAKAQFDELTSLAAKILGTPAAFIAFMGRKEHVMQAASGIEPVVMERRQTFCSNVVVTGEPLIIPDATADSRFSDHPMVAGPPHLRFYLGVPLLGAEGETIGTFCVIDYKPRDMGPSEIETASVLASQAMTQLELRRTEQELRGKVARARQAERRFRRLLDASPDAIVLLHGQKVVALNGSAETLFGVRGGEFLVGRSVFDILGGWGALDSETEVVLRSHALEARRRGVARFEWLQRCAGGGRTPVDVTLSVVEIDRQPHFLVILHDISKQKESERILERERIQAENANRIKDTFLGMISHDLKSPLSSIYSMLELMEEDDGDLPIAERANIYRSLKGSVAVLLEMTTQLLNLHRLQSGTMEINLAPVDPYFIVNQIRMSLDQRIREKGITLDNQYPRGTMIQADVALFREVLFNLLSNAVKFCAEGDVITVGGGNGNTLEVRDTGVGIPQGFLQDLFAKELKTSSPGTDGEQGTGLGLPLCKDIMEAHGGEILVTSNRNEGTRFNLRFPDRAPDGPIELPSTDPI